MQISGSSSLLWRRAWFTARHFASFTALRLCKNTSLGIALVKFAIFAPNFTSRDSLVRQLIYELSLSFNRTLWTNWREQPIIIQSLTTLLLTAGFVSGSHATSTKSYANYEMGRKSLTNFPKRRKGTLRTFFRNDNSKRLTNKLKNYLHWFSLPATPCLFYCPVFRGRNADVNIPAVICYFSMVNRVTDPSVSARASYKVEGDGTTPKN